MTKIILARHGHVEGINPVRFRGRLDLPLTATGKRQAEATAKRIQATWTPSAIYTSPMQRSVATAQAIAAPFVLRVQPVEGLNDIDYGDWQGFTVEEAKSRWPDEIESWFRSPHRAHIPGGEALPAVLSRTSAVLRDVLLNHPDEVAVIVGHESVNRVMLLHVLGLPLSAYWRVAQEPCAINELDFSRDEWTVGSINENWHLHGI